MQGKRNLLFIILRFSYILVFHCMLLPAIKGPAWSGGLYLNEFGTPVWGLPVRVPMPWQAMPPHLFTTQPG